jgi:hypothetical protein
LKVGCGLACDCVPLLGLLADGLVAAGLMVIRGRFCTLILC